MEDERAEAQAPELPDFDAVFAADLDPVRREFTVQGRECWVDLRPLDSNDSDRYASIGMKLEQVEGGLRVAKADVALDERNLFLVSRCVVDFHLWRQVRAKTRDGARAWQEENAPKEDRQRVRYIEQNFRCRPAFWGWLVEQCMDVCGLSEGSAKN